MNRGLCLIPIAIFVAITWLQLDLGTVVLFFAAVLAEANEPNKPCPGAPSGAARYLQAHNEPASMHIYERPCSAPIFL